MNITPIQWIDILKACVPPIITGFVAITAVLMGQSFQRRQDETKRLAEKQRDDNAAKVANLHELIDSLDEVEALNMFCVGQRRNAEEANKAAVTIMPNLNSDPESRKLAPILLQSMTERSRESTDLFFKMHERSMNATRAAHRIGKLPAEIKIEGEESLIEAVRRWRWANVSLAERPNHRAKEVEALIQELRAKIRCACIAYLAVLE